MWMIKRYMTRYSASLIIKGNADQKHKRYFIPAGKGSTKKCKKRRMLLRMWRKGVLMHCWKGGILVQLPQKHTVEFPQEI